MRPIDAERFDVIALDYFEIAKQGYQNTFDDGVQWLSEQIDAAQTLDVAPVVHAKWIECESGWGFKCSNCKARVKRSEVFNGNHHYCYKCGAKIDGGNE